MDEDNINFAKYELLDMTNVFEFIPLVINTTKDSSKDCHCSSSFLDCLKFHYKTGQCNINVSHALTSNVSCSNDSLDEKNINITNNNSNINIIHDNDIMKNKVDNMMTNNNNNNNNNNSDSILNASDLDLKQKYNAILLPSFHLKSFLKNIYDGKDSCSESVENDENSNVILNANKNGDNNHDDDDGDDYNKNILLVILGENGYVNYIEWMNKLNNEFNIPSILVLPNQYCLRTHFDPTIENEFMSTVKYKHPNIFTNIIDKSTDNDINKNNINIFLDSVEEENENPDTLICDHNGIVWIKPVILENNRVLHDVEHLSGYLQKYWNVHKVSFATAALKSRFLNAKLI